MSKARKIAVKLPEHYSSIDFMPIRNWEKVQQEQDFRYLLVKPVKLTKAQKILLAKIWREMYSEYIKVFGFKDSYKAILAKRIEIGILKCEMSETKNKSINNLIRRRQNELNGLLNLNKNSKGDIYTAKMQIEKKMGIHIPMSTLSVREFYNYMKELK